MTRGVQKFRHGGRAGSMVKGQEVAPHVVTVAITMTGGLTGIAFSLLQMR